MIETEVAEFYLEKPELEPTRSILARSAAFLNLKAGNIDSAERFIFWGLANTLDKFTKNQFYEALEFVVSFRNMNKKDFGRSMDYIIRLRQKSILYVIEPKVPIYDTAVTLDMISDFTSNYSDSLKAFSSVLFKNEFNNKYQSEIETDDAAELFKKEINPIVANTGYGSFKIAISMDWINRNNEPDEKTKLKSNILIKYHTDIFTNPLRKKISLILRNDLKMRR